MSTARASSRADSRPTARDGFVRGGPQAGLPSGRLLFTVAAIGLIGLALLAQFGENGIFAFWRLQARATELRTEVAGLEAGNTERQVQLEELETDPEVLERIARERHNMQRTDEEVLTVIPAPVETP